MEEKWVRFLHDGRQLCAYDLENEFAGERQATLESLAAERGIPVESIEVKIG